MKDCNSSLMGIIFGHKFRARYTMSAPTLEKWSSEHPIPLEAFLKIVDASKSRIYQHDICERCGETIPGGVTP